MKIELGVDLHGAPGHRPAFLAGHGDHGRQSRRWFSRGQVARAPGLPAGLGDRFPGMWWSCIGPFHGRWINGELQRWSSREGRHGSRHRFPQEALLPVKLPRAFARHKELQPGHLRLARQSLDHRGPATALLRNRNASRESCPRPAVFGAPTARGFSHPGPH